MNDGKAGTAYISAISKSYNIPFHDKHMSHSQKKFYAHAANLSIISLLVVGTLMPSIMKFSYAANIGVFPADSKPSGLTYG
jgi:hypothetical protein